MSLKILLVSDHYPPFIGGAHRQTQLLSQELRQRGYKVSVATAWHSGFPEEEDEAGVRVYRLKQIRTCIPALVQKNQQQYQAPFPDPVTTLAMRRVIERVQPDVIHSYGWFTYSVVAALVGKNIPLLISARDYAYSCPNRTLVAWNQPCSGPAFWKCIRCCANHFGTLKGLVTALSIYGGRAILLPRVGGIHSISTYVKYIIDRDFLRAEAGQPAGQGATIVQDIIPSFREDNYEERLQDEAQLEPYLQQLPQEPFIMFVGALRLVKGVQQLIDAYKQLNNPPPLVLIGTVEYDTPKNFPPNTFVLQKFPHPAVMAAWKRSLFGVIPSLWPEPLGSVVYEGMSQGKAIIGTTPGGHTDMIVQGETGFLIPLGEISSLVTAMQTLIDNPVLREQMGAAGQKRARIFTAQNSVPRFERLYQQLAGAKATQKG